MPMEIKQTKESLLTEITWDCPERFRHMDGFMFQAFECAVFETAVNRNRYDYTAHNIHSGKTELIDRKRSPLHRTDDDVTAFLLKLQDSRLAGRGRLQVDSDTPMRVEKLRAVMYEVFREILPRYGYSVRDGQVELAERLLEAVAARGTLLAEAAVGIGKTLAYLIIGILVKRSRLNEHWNSDYFPEVSVVEWKRMPIVVSTSSIALQKSIETEAVPEISRILLESGVIKKPIRTALIKGRSHYVCEHRLHAHLPYERKPEIADVLQRLAFDGRVIDLSEVGGLTEHVKKKICVPRKCYENCPYAEDCRFRAFRADVRTGDADVIICNHNLLLADAKLRATEGKSVLPPYQMLIIDEAHEALPAARSTFGAELSSETIQKITRAILDLDFAPEPSEETKDWRDIRDIAHRLAEKLYGQSRRLFAKDDANAGCDRQLLLIRNIAGELHYVLKKTYPFKNKLDESRRIALLNELERLGELVTPIVSSRTNIRWFERSDAGDSAIHSLPKNLNEIIYADLWKRGVPTLLTSGTLSVNGDFGALKNSLGLNGVKRLFETTQESPYDYRENALLYISENVPFYKDENYIAELTDEVERLIPISD